MVLRGLILMPLLSELSRLFRNFANGLSREMFMSANRVPQDVHTLA